MRVRRHALPARPATAFRLGALEVCPDPLAGDVTGLFPGCDPAGKVAAGSLTSHRFTPEPPAAARVRRSGLNATLATAPACPANGAPSSRPCDGSLRLLRPQADRRTVGHHRYNRLRGPAALASRRIRAARHQHHHEDPPEQVPDEAQPAKDESDQ